MFSSRITSLAKNCNARSLSYAAERLKHKQELTVLRKQWMQEHKDKLAKEEEKNMEKKKKLILQKAIKLREKKSRTVAGMEKQQKIREESLARYKEKLAMTQMLMADKEAKQKQMYIQAAKDLEEESKHWITLENMDSKITEALFAQPATTGLTSKHSDMWRYHAFNLTLERLNHMEATPQTAMEFRRAMRADEALDKRIEAENYLNSIIGSGEDRAKYSELLDEYLQVQARQKRTAEEEEEFEAALASVAASGRENDSDLVFEENEEDEELEQMPEIEKKKKSDDGRNRRFGKMSGGGKK